MIRKLSIIPGFMLIVLLAWGQSNNEGTDMQVSVSSFISGNEVQAFWLHVNRLGKVDENEPGQGIVDFSLKKMHIPDHSDKMYLEGGLNFSGRYYGNTRVQLLEYWGRFNYKNFYFHAGAKGEPEFANGLSVSNGNLYLSNNARPLPRVEFGVKAFRPFRNGFWEKFSFDGLYSEYFLLDDRYIKNAHLHRKRLGINYEFLPSWTFSLAMDHWAFWGGEFPDGDKIPGFEYYFRYILGRGGGEKSKVTEQENAAGNHTGQYQFLLKYNRYPINLDFYWQHLWEDGSGLKFKNISDGLWGVAIKNRGNKKLINTIVLEYIYTKHQSGPIHGEDPDRIGKFIGGRDNYFNHGIYRSGYTSYGRMIGLPLLIPSVGENGVSNGFPNNRLWGIHSGFSGQITEMLFWKVLLTYSKHFGTYATPFPNSKDLFSAGFDLLWERSPKPFSYRIKLATDRGSYLPETTGLEFAVTYRF